MKLLTPMLAPVRVMVLPPVTVSVPPATADGPLVADRPAGRTVVTATPVSGTVLAGGLVMVKFKLVVPLSGIGLVPKLAAMVGGTTTTRLRDAVLPLPP